MVTCVQMMILSLIEAWRVILNPVDLCGGQSARDNIIDVIKPALQTANVAQRTGFVANQ